jgi:hypothetical protein
MPGENKTSDWGMCTNQERGQKTSVFIRGPSWVQSQAKFYVKGSYVSILISWWRYRAILCWVGRQGTAPDKGGGMQGYRDKLYGATNMAQRKTSDAQLGCAIALLDDARSTEDKMCSSAAILPGSTVALRLQFQPWYPRRKNILKAVWELEPCNMPLF